MTPIELREYDRHRNTRDQGLYVDAKGVQAAKKVAPDDRTKQQKQDQEGPSEECRGIEGADLHASRYDQEPRMKGHRRNERFLPIAYHYQDGGGGVRHLADPLYAGLKRQPN